MGRKHLLILIAFPLLLVACVVSEEGAEIRKMPDWAEPYMAVTEREVVIYLIRPESVGSGHEDKFVEFGKWKVASN